MTTPKRSNCFKLIHLKNNEEIKIGATVADYRGDIWKLTNFTPPKHPGSTGRVTLENKFGTPAEYYPGVINAKIVKQGRKQ